MSDEIKNLKKIESEYYRQIQEIKEKIKLLEELPRAKSLVGKCFKYLNSFGPNENWWLYIRIVRNDGCDVIIDKFQEDAYGKVEFFYAEVSYSHYFGSSYIPISEEEYFKAEKKLLNKITKRYEKSRGK